MPTSAVRPNQRERILDAALALMAEHGSAGTSMRMLARACDLNVAAIYHYFPSKDALLAAVIDERRYEARLAEIPDLSPDLPAAERLAQIYRTVWAGALAEEPVWRLLLGEGIRGEEAALPVGRSLLEVFGPGLAGWIAATVPEVIDPGAVAEVVIGQLFAGFVRHIFEPDRPLAELEDAGAAAVIGAVLPGPTGA
jgi:AcrR family transcriptional regulator